MGHPKGAVWARDYRERQRKAKAMRLAEVAMLKREVERLRARIVELEESSQGVRAAAE